MTKISEKTMSIHRDKLYAGYVKKAEEVWGKLRGFAQNIKDGKEAPQGNATYSELRALKDDETFAVNGMYLHEWYFDELGGDGDWKNAPELTKAIETKWGSMGNFIKYF